MARHARAGHNAERKTREGAAAALVGASEQNPLDFALAVMRDDSKSDALRAAMAKAALPYLHKRGEEQETDATEPEPKSEPMSDLELARRIAHILVLGNKQEEREAAETAATRSEGEDAVASTAPHSPPANAGQPRMPSERVSADSERVQRSTEPDPHPAYRWIP